MMLQFILNPEILDIIWYLMSSFWSYPNFHLLELCFKKNDAFEAVYSYSIAFVPVYVTNILNFTNDTKLQMGIKHGVEKFVI